MYNMEKPELVIPPDLMDALSLDKAARQAFEALPPSHKKEYVQWILDAKKEETRNSRVIKTIEKLTAQHKG